MQQHFVFCRAPQCPFSLCVNHRSRQAHSCLTQGQRLLAGGRHRPRSILVLTLSAHAEELTTAACICTIADDHMHGRGQCRVMLIESPRFTTAGRKLSKKGLMDPACLLAAWAKTCKDPCEICNGKTIQHNSP